MKERIYRQVSDVNEMLQITPDMRDIRMWILWNGMGGFGGTLHFYFRNGKELIFGRFEKKDQTELINKMVLLPNGDESLPVYNELNVYSGFSSEEHVGFWGIEKARHDNYLFFREHERADVTGARPDGIFWVGPMEWVQQFGLE